MRTPLVLATLTVLAAMSAGAMVLAVSGELVAACANPTAVEVVVYSEVPCAAQADVALSVASNPQSLASALTSAVATECDDGGDSTATVRRGSVIIAPQGAKDEPIAFQLLTRNDNQALDVCAASFTGCIAARRQMLFQPRTTIQVTVDLRLSCLSIVCPVDQTCVKGQCVSSVLPPCTECGEPSTDAAAPNVCGDTSGLQDGGPWPVAYGCPTNAGRSAFDGPKTGATAVPPEGTVSFPRGAIVGAGNQVYVLDSSGHAFDFDAVTGTQKWATNPVVGTNSPVMVIDDQSVLYATTNYGKFFSIDSTSGMVRWQIQLDGAFSPPVIAAPGTAYFGAAGPWGFYAVDLVARAQKWHFDVPNNGNTASAPAVGNGLVYAIDSQNSLLYAMVAASGTQKFAVPIPAPAPSVSPVLGLDAVYIATNASGIVALDVQTGAMKWKYPVTEAVAQPALLANGNLISSTASGSAFVLDYTTGHEVGSSTSLGGGLTGGPILGADETAFYGTGKGTLAITTTGGMLWQSAWMGPIALGNGRLIVQPGSNALAVIGP